VQLDMVKHLDIIQLLNIHVQPLTKLHLSWSGKLK